MSASDSTTSVEYRQVIGTIGYRVGDDGSAWSLWGVGRYLSRNNPGTVWRRLKPRKKPPLGYLVVRIAFLDGRSFPCLLHRLVLEAFIGPCPTGMEACHNDGDPSNNRPSNLRWDTRKANIRDQYKHGTRERGEQHPLSKLDAEKVREIRRFRSEGCSAGLIAEYLGVSRYCVRCVLDGKTWTHVK